MNISGPIQPKSELEALMYTKESVMDSVGVMLDVGNKNLLIRKSKIKDVAAGLAEIAYNIGQTNDPETFADEMAENIFQALKKVKNSKNKLPKKKK